MSKQLVLAFAVFAGGCVVSHEPPIDNPPPDSNPVNPIVPRTGVWFYDGITPVSNDCNPSLVLGEGGDFLIDSSSLTSFHVDPNDGNPAFTCSLSSGSYSCPDRIAKVMDYRPSVDAIATFHVDVDGTFATSTHATGTQRATVDCIGSACTAYGPFPCHFQQKYAITAR